MSSIHKCSGIFDAYGLPEVVEMKNIKEDKSVLRVKNSLCKQESLEEGVETCENVYESHFDVYEEELVDDCSEIKYYMLNDVDKPTNLSVKVEITALEAQSELFECEEIQILHRGASPKYDIETLIKVEQCDYLLIPPANCVKTINTPKKDASSKNIGLKKASSTKRSIIHRKTTKTQIVEKPFSCDICKTKFTLRANLYKHMKIIHTAKKPFACHVCGFEFFWQYRLKEHMRSHEGSIPEEKPYSCHICGNKFMNKSNLTAHIKKHSDVKPFCCDICGRKYLTKGSLGVHMRNHTGEKPFACHICSAKFIAKSYLKCHLIAHFKQRQRSLARS